MKTLALTLCAHNVSQRLYNVHNFEMTSYERNNDVICVLERGWSKKKIKLLQKVAQLIIQVSLHYLTT